MKCYILLNLAKTHKYNLKNNCIYEHLCIYMNIYTDVCNVCACRYNYVFCFPLKPLRIVCYMVPIK